MTNTHYNLPSNAMNQLVPAGILAMNSLSAFPQQVTAERESRGVFGAAYRLASNSATYSHFGGYLTGEYNYTKPKLQNPWMTPEMAGFLSSSLQISAADLDYLVVAIRDTYGDVQIDASIHTDPEEGWSKPVFVIHSGTDDFDALMEVEDSFFDKAAVDSTLLEVLPFVVLMQA